MAKVSEVVIDALEGLLIQSDEARIEQSESQAAIRTLNDMMAAWAALGIDLDYEARDNMGQDMGVPAGALFGIKANLSLALAPVYEVTVTQDLKEKARKGYLICVAISEEMSDSAYPSTLPRGSGNAAPGDVQYYPDQQSDIYDLETGS